MTEIKAKISDLLELNEILSMTGVDQKGKRYSVIPDYLIEAKKDSYLVEQKEPNAQFLQVEAIDIRKALTLKMQFNKVEVVEAGQIPIGDAEKFGKFLSRFNASDEVTLKTSGNNLVISRVSPAKVARYKLADLESLTTTKGASVMLAKFPFVDGYPKSEKTHLNLKLTVKVDKMKEVILDGETVGQRIYPLTVEGSKATMKVGSATLGEIETDVEASMEKEGNVRTAFAYGLDNVFSGLSGEVTIYAEDKSESKPIMIQQKTDKFEILVLLAPVSVEK